MRFIGILLFSLASTNLFAEAKLNCFGGQYDCGKDYHCEGHKMGTCEKVLNFT